MKNITSQEIVEFIYKPLFDEKIILNKDPSWPKISIVTPSYNQAEFLERTILSVLNQNYPNLEYIIIDGGSTDGGVEIIKKYEKYLAYWVSEPDEGIYDAMNKGWDIASGDYILFLGCGDLLIEIPKDELIQLKNKEFLIGSVKISNGKIFKPSFSQKIKLLNTIHHQGMFISNTSKFIIGKFNSEYKVLGDFDLNQRLYKHRYKAIVTDKILAFHNIGGISSSGYGRYEQFKIIHNNFGIFYKIIAFLYMKFLALKIRFINFIKVLNFKTF
jgi:glycosyltransferase involved in cell wall biosynthesis